MFVLRQLVLKIHKNYLVSHNNLRKLFSAEYLDLISKIKFELLLLLIKF